MLQGITVNLYRSIIPAGRSLFVLPNVCCGISGASTCFIIAFICATINLAPFSKKLSSLPILGCVHQQLIRELKNTKIVVDH